MPASLAKPSPTGGPFSAVIFVILFNDLPQIDAGGSIIER